MGSGEKWEALAKQSVKTIKLSAMTETVTHTGFWLTQKQYTVKPIRHYGLVCMDVRECEFIGFGFLCATKSKYIHLMNTFMTQPTFCSNRCSNPLITSLIWLYSMSVIVIMCSIIKSPYMKTKPLNLSHSLWPPPHWNILPQCTLSTSQRAHKELKIPGPYFQLWHTTQTYLSPLLWPLFEKSRSAQGRGSKFI